MKRLNTHFLLPLTTLVILISAFSIQMFNIPPLAKLLDPFIGAVQNEREQGLTDLYFNTDDLGLSDSVSVFFDDRKVPHIFAKNTEDLYFAQGYVTAYLRLWQMDFLSYASAGRLSEIFGKEEFLKFDRTQRRAGILEAAKRSLEVIEKNPETNKVLTAYSRGVNAFIEQLDYKKMPLEYKLLDYKPESWSNLKTVLILKHMANMLSGYEEDMSMSNMMLALGEEKFNKLFPDFHAHTSPLINEQKPESTAVNPAIKKPEYLNYSFITANSVIAKNAYNPKLGSNNWAVSGKKTKSKSPILCSDPHLNLSFPCIWLEMQLSSPEMNVYGVVIPGTPSVTIGFNENIAWGITNGADDVKDWYKLKITEDYKKYEFDGKWIDLNYSIEEIKRKGQNSFYDTVYTSIHGPVLSDRNFPEIPELKNCALRWELHNASNEFLTFIKLNKAKNYEEYKQALKYFSCPTQNFVFACKDNTISINHQGNMPIKSAGKGKFILDGTQSSYLYTRYIPEDSLPHFYNPACGYVFSANQHPTYPDYPYYYNGYYSETRANQIKKNLENEDLFDIQKMQAMQLDNTNAFAVEVLPFLIKSIQKNKLNKSEEQEVYALNNWNGVYNLNDENAQLFELWWKNINDYTWDELKRYSFYLKPPDDYVLLDLIQNEPENMYFDRQETSTKENADNIIRDAFFAASKEYNNLKTQGGVKWGDHNKVTIAHMTGIEAFSKMNLSSAGYPEAINAMAKNFGPSWRMIVELGDRPKAFGVYPGGQSGNVGSAYYDNFVSNWNEGKYYPLQFYISFAEAKQHATNTWTLK